MEWIQFLALPIGYLLGSIPSAYLVGRLISKTDARTEGDGKISAAVIYRRAGLRPFLLVVTMDVVKGLLAVIIARLLSGYLIESIQDIPLQPQVLIMGTGILAVIAHDWSPFLKFKGGLGATSIYGALGGVLLFQTIIALIIGAIIQAINRKSGRSTIIILILICVMLIIQNFMGLPITFVIGIYPLAMGLIMLIKRFQVKMTGPRL
jgi:acyl phosphate:glycerol-3-phosphate acyltransferase